MRKPTRRLHPIDHLPGVHQGNVELVQGLPAVRMRPPALDDACIDGDRRAGVVDLVHRCRHLGALGVAERDGDSLAGARRRGDDQLDAAPIAVGDHRRRPDRHQAVDAPAAHGDGAPDSRCRQRWPPIPAPAARHLAEVVERPIERCRRPVTFIGPQGIAMSGGRPEGDDQFVVAFDQSRSDVEPVGPVHVLGRAEDLAVERDRCQRVEAVEAELDVFVPEDVVRRREGGDVGPVAVRDPLDQQFVGVEEWVGGSLPLPAGRCARSRAPSRRPRAAWDVRRAPARRAAATRRSTTWTHRWPSMSRPWLDLSRPGDLGVPQGTLLRCAVLGGPVDCDETELGPISVRPLEVVEQ